MREIRKMPALWLQASEKQIRPQAYAVYTYI